MAAPIETYIQLPDDAGNTGKKIRTQSLSVGGNTVHQHHFIPISKEIIKGVYYSVGAVYLITTSAQNGTSTGIWWLSNPVNSMVNLRIRRLEMSSGVSATAASSNGGCPRISFTRFSFTGIWTGAAQTITKRKTSEPTSRGDARTATTGATVTLQSACWSFHVSPQVITTAGVTIINTFSYWHPLSEDEYFIIQPGEGLVCYQSDAGSGTEIRYVLPTICWDEVDNVT